MQGVRFTLHKGERIVITGANGTGKTTILAAAAGLLSIDSGPIQKAPSAKLAYLDQEIAMLSLDQTPLEYFNTCFNLLEEALQSFEGAILAVSHDSTFIDKIATSTWSIG